MRYLREGRIGGTLFEKTNADTGIDVSDGGGEGEAEEMVSAINTNFFVDHSLPEKVLARLRLQQEGDNPRVSIRTCTGHSSRWTFGWSLREGHEFLLLMPSQLSLL